MRYWVRFNAPALKKILTRWSMLIIGISGVLSALMFTIAYVAGMKMSIGRVGFVIACLSIIASTIVCIVLFIPISR